MVALTSRKSPLDSFLDEFFQGQEQLFRSSKNSGFPRTDIYSTDEQLHFDFALAGFNQDQIDIDMNPETATLTVKSINSFPKMNEDTVRWHQRQLGYRDFSVKYMIPTGYDLDSCQANFNNGILSITLARNPEMKSRKILIE